MRMKPRFTLLVLTLGFLAGALLGPSWASAGVSCSGICYWNAEIHCAYCTYSLFFGEKCVDSNCSCAEWPCPYGSSQSAGLDQLADGSCAGGEDGFEAERTSSLLVVDVRRLEPRT